LGRRERCRRAAALADPAMWLDVRLAHAGRRRVAPTPTIRDKLPVGAAGLSSQRRPHDRRLWRPFPRPSSLGRDEPSWRLQSAACAWLQRNGDRLADDDGRDQRRYPAGLRSIRRRGVLALASRVRRPGMAQDGRFGGGRREDGR
jgi:hypothetical protein